MKSLYWPCERCGQKIYVEPSETSQYRGISCPNADCGAFYSVLNAELIVEEAEEDSSIQSRT